VQLYRGDEILAHIHGHIGHSPRHAAQRNPDTNTARNSGQLGGTDKSAAQLSQGLPKRPRSACALMQRTASERDRARVETALAMSRRSSSPM
jgi:hypothetical protein